MVNNAGGNFDISRLTSAGTTVGSIAGLGSFDLGSKTLTVGGNNINSVAGGTIADGGSGLGVGGVLAKAGTGTLTLTGRNTTPEGQR